MNEKLLHTPDGVRDIYDLECKRKLKVLEQIHHVLLLYSYQDISTPTFEYFDIFNMDKGSAPSNEMFKFFDRNNNTLVLRPDITPSVARCVAKYYADVELPIRLCYSGNSFKNAQLHQGKLSEFTQVGGELINDDSSAADAEIIACVISCLKEVGLKEFQIEIGEVDYLKGIIEEAGIDTDTEEKIKEYIQIKNFFGLSEFVSRLDIPDKIKKALSGFDMLFGGLDMLEQAKELVFNERSLEAIERMKRVYNAIISYGYEEYISFDLSMINGYNYYTGIIFNGYTYGTGDAIVKGGRYNNLMSQFGKEAPSVGFAIYVDDLMSALSRNKIDVPLEHSNILVLYDREYQKEAIKLAAYYRQNNKKVELIRKSAKHDIEDYIKYAKQMHFLNMYVVKEDEKLDVYSTTSDTVTESDIKTIKSLVIDD
ncbi:MAG: ATP phosphoribosyltransferase regulatory subunit [Lachnospiraceae bacterium]|nr:ATP phosphoribosyltransferase regulatory subunit [Lachnospiraceae bacterium]